MIHRGGSPKKKRWAQRLRRKQTRAERAFWEILKKVKAEEGIAFWRQIVLLGWIADFWCPSLKLVIEIDGASHDNREAYDNKRARVMQEELGARTIRFTNFEVINNPEIVRVRLLEEIRRRRRGR